MVAQDEYICPETGVDLTTDPPPLAQPTLGDGTPRCGYLRIRPDAGGIEQCVKAKDHADEHAGGEGLH